MRSTGAGTGKAAYQAVRSSNWKERFIRYSPFLSDIVLWQYNLMPMISVYCDDSGTHSESRVAAVSGYISNVGQWEIFTKEWSSTLRDFKVQRMHRADLESLRGEFKGWSRARRETFLQRLHSILKRRTKVAIGSAVITKDFEEIVP